jgi:hypothetical protein
VLTGGGDDSASAYEGGGVVWAAPQTVNKITFMNGSFNSSTYDGVFDNHFSLQTTADGTTWSSVSGWSLTPAYQYNLAAAAGATYTFTGPALSIRGFRVVGQVHSLSGSDSWYDDATEIQAFYAGNTSGSASSLTISTSSTTTTAGTAFNVTVTATTASGATATGYVGTVHFTSSDGQAGLPVDYTFTAADAGVRKFSVTLKTAGSQSITATDTIISGITGTQPGITVNPAVASTLIVSGFASPIPAGTAANLTVTAKDPYGNVATGYQGTVHFTSSDAGAVLPANYTFVAMDAGLHTFSVTLITAGTQSITASDTVSGITGSLAGISVTAVNHVWQQASAADFNAGVYSGTGLANPQSGGLQLAPTFADNFAGTQLSSSWTASGKASVSAGVLSLTGGSIYSVQSAGSSGVEAYIQFGQASGQQFGLASTQNGKSGSWALFTTYNTSHTLYARLNTQIANLEPLPSGFHDYVVQPISGGYQFYVDGILLKTLFGAMSSGTVLQIALTSLRSAPLQAEWVRLLSYPSSGTFASAVFDAGRVASWGTASWTSTMLAGTVLTIQTRSGNTATPDSSWSGWTAVSNGGQVASPQGRYLQYLVTMTTTNASVTPVLFSLDFNWS